MDSSVMYSQMLGTGNTICSMALGVGFLHYIHLMHTSHQRSGSSSFLKAQKAFEVTEEASFSCPRMSSLIWSPESFPRVQHLSSNMLTDTVARISCWAKRIRS
ncbi:hypothetical protein EYF80_059087 [Liparis tanakae]|uniref:Uncharacterized protein n=1 Tax=Liparis tanakae TaxID=230148 RepID=A0A4Z2EQB8_9TELE|nr:hypothetical protein EYF80_059087 [Liparis tanakae]